jgi:hypothetical protein
VDESVAISDFGAPGADEVDLLHSVSLRKFADLPSVQHVPCSRAGWPCAGTNCPQALHTHPPC